MNCREFKSKHVGFIDDVLCAADMAAMRRHIGVCARCSTIDIRIRRSLMVVRNLPQVELSSDFYPRLIERLQRAPAPFPAERASSAVATFVVVTAALAAAVYFAMAVGVRQTPTIAPVRTQTIAVARPAQMTPRTSINTPEFVPTVPAGVPVWPAMFMVGELPMHLNNVDLLENSVGR